MDQDAIAGFGEYDYDYYDEEEEETEPEPEEDKESESEPEPEPYENESDSTTTKEGIKGAQINGIFTRIDNIIKGYYNNSPFIINCRRKINFFLALHLL